MDWQWIYNGSPMEVQWNCIGLAMDSQWDCKSGRPARMDCWAIGCVARRPDAGAVPQGARAWSKDGACARPSMTTGGPWRARRCKQRTRSGWRRRCTPPKPGGSARPSACPGQAGARRAAPPSGGEAPCDDDDLDTAAIFERELVRAARAWAARRKRILIKAKRRAREVERAMRRAAHKQLRGARLRRWLRLHKQQRRAGNSS